MNENSKDCIHLEKDEYWKRGLVYICAWFWIIYEPQVSLWLIYELQRLLPSTSRTLDYGYYKPAQQKKQLIRYGYYTRKSSAIMV